MFDEIAPVYDRLNTIMTARRRRALATGGRRATGLGLGRLGGRRRVRDGQAERRAGRTGRPIRSRRRGRPRTRDDRRRRGGRRATSSSSSSASATPSPCRSTTGASTRRRSPSACATWPTSRPGSASSRGSSGRAVGSSAWSCPSLVRAGWGAAYRATFRRLAPLAAAAFGQGRDLPLPAGLARGVPRPGGAGHDDGPGRPRRRRLPAPRPRRRRPARRGPSATDAVGRSPVVAAGSAGVARPLVRLVGASSSSPCRSASTR